MFVTTKLAAEVKSFEEAATAIDESLATTGLDYLDMMIIHSPQPWDEFGGDDRYFEGNREAWRALEEAYDARKLRAIGLSNFQATDIDNILAACARSTPMVNQILVHISNTPSELIAYSQQQGMLVEAYSPMAHGELFKNAAGRGHGREVRRVTAAALHPLHPPARSPAAAQDREPGPHADQRRRRLRDRRRRHGGLEEHRGNRSTTATPACSPSTAGRDAQPGTRRRSPVPSR